MRVAIDTARRVTIESAFDVPLPARWVWNEMKDLRHFATADPFHQKLEIEGETPRMGAPILIHHRYAGFRVLRTGRILRWRPGREFAFSDLSRRGARRGFPHIFRFRVEPIDDANSRVTITIRGRWTLKRLPRPAAWLWLWWVSRMTVDAASNHLLRVAVYRDRASHVTDRPLRLSEQT